MDKILNMLGLMRRANAIQIGETNTGSAVRAGKGKLLLLAADASDNAKGRAQGFARGRNITTVSLPYTKEEISAAVGVSGCSMASVTDLGFANALMKALSEAVPDAYSEAAGEVEERLQRAQRRKSEADAHRRNKRFGKRRTNV